MISGEELGSRLIEFGEQIRDQQNTKLRALLARQAAEYIVVMCTDIPPRELQTLVSMCFASVADRAEQ
jgi:hypothetical protein